MATSVTASKKIRILPRELAEKIAAGEVIERPGSVIKELVENSIDAGATRITVEIEDGGKKLIRISDNGHGIQDDDFLTALERHATSKIQQLDDLWNLSTMGFRGEALPSIAAISRFTLRSRARGDKGREVYLEGGRLLRNEPLIGEIETGTTITIEDLFFNVPARLKFQRTRSGESAFVREMIEHFALVNPTIGFSLISEGRKSVNFEAASGENAELARIADVFEIALDDLEEFSSRFDDIVVHGYLDRNTRASNSKQIFLAANSRIVKDKLLQQAVITALRPRMMEGEYPRLFMSVNVAPTDVDVNVHPTKSEVRFRRSRDVFQVVHGALSKLAANPSKPFYSADTSFLRTPSQNFGTSFSAPAPQPAEFQPSIFQGSTEENRSFYKTKSFSTEPAVESNTRFTENTTIANTNVGFTSLHYIGQLKNTYLLFQDADGLVLIDQHAAHERINYERIREQFMKEGLRAQPLLVSITVKCKAEDTLVATDHFDAFNKLGFEVEIFGNDCLILRAIPEGLNQMHAKDLFMSLLQELRDVPAADVLTDDPSRLSAKLERILSTSACHASVRAGQSLSAQEAFALASDMEKTASSLNCPHGRPASIKLTFGQIEGLFKR